MWLVRLRMRDARPWARGLNRLSVGPWFAKHLGNIQRIGGKIEVVFRVGDRGVENLARPARSPPWGCTSESPVPL